MRVPGTIVLNCCLYASDGMRIETIVARERKKHTKVQEEGSSEWKSFRKFELKA